LQNSPYSVKDEQRLMVEMWDPIISENPYNWVMFTFPWGKPGTRLEHVKGPHSWQKDEMLRIAEHIRKSKAVVASGKKPEIYQSATASGRGVGKSALTAWLNLWMMSCNLGSTSIALANSETQLKSRTFGEVGKWHALMINSHWFERTSLSLTPTAWFNERIKTELGIDSGLYYAAGQTWTEENPDSFAGAHNRDGMLVILDEASGIPKPIWTVVQGFFTDVSIHRYFLCFSNPRRNTGEFYECFHKNRDYWLTRNLDSRTVEDADVAYLNKIIAQHGNDSDEARIEVKGEFPNQGDKQFISRDVVEGSVVRAIEEDRYAGLIMGVDIARFGDDSTVIYFRRGRDARTIPPIKLKGQDNMQVANLCAKLIDKHRPDAVCIDAGNGTGVIDRLREMKYKVSEIWFGSKANEEEYADLRTEMWAKMRDWLKGGCIVDDKHLKDDLVGPEYGFDKLERIKLEAKEAMKKRGVASPDNGDALACTFAVKVARSDINVSQKRRGQNTAVAGTDYDIFSKG
jgi:hypothetical protein